MNSCVFNEINLPYYPKKWKRRLRKATGRCIRQFQKLAEEADFLRRSGEYAKGTDLMDALFRGMNEKCRTYTGFSDACRRGMPVCNWPKLRS